MIKIGIFGTLDADKIPENPYWVAAGTYRAIITSAYFQENTDKGITQLVICYSITEDDSEFFNQELRDYFEVHPEITEETWETLAPHEQQSIRKALSAVQARLCGTEKRAGLGVDRVDLDEDWDPKTLVGTEVNLTVKNSGEKNEYANVRGAVAV